MPAGIPERTFLPLAGAIPRATANENRPKTSPACSLHIAALPGCRRLGSPNLSSQVTCISQRFTVIAVDPPPIHLDRELTLTAIYDINPDVRITSQLGDEFVGVASNTLACWTAANSNVPHNVLSIRRSPEKDAAQGVPEQQLITA